MSKFTKEEDNFTKVEEVNEVEVQNEVQPVQETTGRPMIFSLFCNDLQEILNEMVNRKEYTQERADDVLKQLVNDYGRYFN